MAYKKNWKPGRAATREFAQEMSAIREFCAAHGIDASASCDSYYFTVAGVKYRVSNHTIEASNRGAYDPITGEKRRELYHAGRDVDTVYIHAGKTRIIEIYTAIQAGKKLDGRGYAAN